MTADRLHDHCILTLATSKLPCAMSTIEITEKLELNKFSSNRARREFSCFSCIFTAIIVNAQIFKGPVQ